MKTDHNLIDRIDPHCLYCNGVCNVDLGGAWLPGTSTIVDTDTLACQKCGEIFIIHSMQNSAGETTYDGFTFSCKDMVVFHNLAESYFDIKDKKGKYITAIPAFEVDFSDKDKLHQKLKTYILFS